jgi:hypothetical protein
MAASHHMPGLLHNRCCCCCCCCCGCSGTGTGMVCAPCLQQGHIPAHKQNLISCTCNDSTPAHPTRRFVPKQLAKQTVSATTTARGLNWQ